MRTLPVGASVAVSVPASSANLGPGFDTIGLALGIYDRYAVQVLPEEAGFKVVLEGEGAAVLPSDDGNLVVASLRRALLACGFEWRRGYGLKVVCSNAVPMAAGLGSSAAAAVGGLGMGFALARAAEGYGEGGGSRGADLTGAGIVGELTEADLGLVNTHAGIAEGHPDNSSASVYGGLTVSWMPSEQVVRTARLTLHPEVEPVVLIPSDVRLNTSVARALLGPQVSRADAVRQAGRAALLVHALTQEPSMLLDATQDWLHQEPRREAYPVTMGAVDTLRSLGHAAVVSGAGPAVLCLTTSDLVEVVVSEAKLWGRDWQILTPGVPSTGLAVR